MAKEITKEESKTIIVRLLWGLGFFWIALNLREWVIEKYGTTTALWLGIGIVLLIAYIYKLRLPYWLKDGDKK